MRPRDLAGKTFGKLYVERRAGSDGRGQSRWLCRCECGVEKVMRGAEIVRGMTHSCGCWRSSGAPRRRHGQAVHREGLQATEYRIWVGINTRCRNPRSQRYGYYGGRGITICERWRLFENFLADMGRRPSPRHSIDRINNDGNYEPGNCRWATPSEQRRNQRPRRRKARVTDTDLQVEAVA